jgi:hypothetical protein
LALIQLLQDTFQSHNKVAIFGTASSGGDVPPSRIAQAGEMRSLLLSMTTFSLPHSSF